MDEREYLTPDEMRVVDLLGEAFTIVKERVIPPEGSQAGYDLAEFAALVHGGQNFIFRQAAARAYPGKYRLAGLEVGQVP